MNNVLFSSIIIIFALSIFQSCTDNSTNSGSTTPVDSTSFKYPLKDGNSWNYSRTVTVSNIRPDSIRHLFSQYPINGTGTVTVLYDTIINSVTLKCLGEIYTEGNTSRNMRRYMLNTDSALYSFAYMNGGIFTPVKKEQQIFFKFRDKLYFPIEFQNALDFQQDFVAQPLTDSLITEIPPRLTLKYPEISGTKWVWKYFPPDTLYKQYVRFENVLVNNQPVSCVKVHMWWSNYANLNMYDYYSKDGLMRKELAAKDIAVTDEFGVTLGYIDENELSVVTSYNIINP